MGIKRRPPWVFGLCLGIFIAACVIDVIKLTDALPLPAFQLGKVTITMEQMVPSLPFSFIAVFWQMTKDWKVSEDKS